MKKKIAVVLCGSGYLDGSEIRESVGVLWALSRHDVEVQCFAPDSAQADVINCLTGEPVPGESRNMLVESARIARGQVKALDQLKPEDFDALIMPGGFGAAKNLCNFAAKGSQGVVCADLLKVLEPMKKAGKPIGAVCIAPAILALAFKGEGLELTVGAFGEVAQEIQKLGHIHQLCLPSVCHVDRKNKVVTTPAYMWDSASLHDIFHGIQSLVDEVVALI